MTGGICVITLVDGHGCVVRADDPRKASSVVDLPAVDNVCELLLRQMRT
jgi:hypothetical protein